jgi:hypothetical protein
VDLPERNLVVLAESPKGATAANQLAAQDLVPADMAALAKVVNRDFVLRVLALAADIDLLEDQLVQAETIVQDLDVKVLAIPDQDQAKVAAPLLHMVVVTVVKDVLMHLVQQVV